MANILKALSEGTEANGGFVVPEILSREILAYVQANTVTLDDMQRVDMTSDELRLPKLTGGSTVRLGVGENSTITGGDIAFGRTTMSAVKFAALMTASTELLEDAPQVVANIISEQMGKDLGLAIDNQILGTSTTNFADAIGYTGNASNSISAGTLSWEAFVSGSNLLLQDNQPQPDVMYTNPVNLRKLQLLTDSSGRQLLNNETYGSPLLKEGVLGTFNGMKIKTTTQLTTSSIVLAKSGQYGYYGVRRNIKFNRFYEIGSDDFIFQSNMRCAFAAKYKEAYALMHHVA